MNNLFDYIKSLITKEKYEFESFKNSNLIVIKALSSKVEYFTQVEFINKILRKLPYWAVHYFLFYSLPKSVNPPFLKFFKKDTIENEEILVKICQHFNCSLLTAKQFLQIFIKENINIKSYFGIK